MFRDVPSAQNTNRNNDYKWCHIRWSNWINIYFWTISVISFHGRQSLSVPVQFANAFKSLETVDSSEGNCSCSFCLSKTKKVKLPHKERVWGVARINMAVCNSVNYLQKKIQDRVTRQKDAAIILHTTILPNQIYKAINNLQVDSTSLLNNQWSILRVHQHNLKS